jgi:DNA-binding LytR/AlgR family response regulator
VDDNELDRLNLRLLLSRVTDVELVGEAGDVPAARKLLARLKPDALFLDIRLKDQNAFVLKDDIRQVPYVIFATMYDKYALQAFDVAAFDYLLKPVTEKRMVQTLERLRARLDADRQVRENATPPTDHVLMDVGASSVLLKLDEVAAVIAERDYTRVLDRRGREFLTRRRMKEWQTLLQNRLALLDRSILLNLDCLESFDRASDSHPPRLHLVGRAAPLEIGDTAFRRLLQLGGQEHGEG